jgi:hypothetical protein
MTKRIVECGRRDSIGANPHEVAADRFLDLLARLIARAHVCEERVGDEQDFVRRNGKQTLGLPQKGDPGTHDRDKKRSKER